MSQELTLFVGMFTTLLAIINPLEALPVYLKLLEGKGEDEHRRVARLSCFYALLLAFFFLFFGNLREIVPSPPEQATAPACDHAQGAPRLSWARLLKRVFDIDIEHCPNCGGSLKIIACPEPRRRAAIEDPPVIVKILAHLGLPTRAPPRSPAQRFDLFQTI